MACRNSYLGVSTLVVALLVAGACSHRPSNVLDDDKMVSLMADMELAEAYATQDMKTNTSEYKLELGEQVLAKHGVSKETLDTTLAWYGRNMDDFTELFERVDKEINKRRKRLVTSESVATVEYKENLWPYPLHLMVNPAIGSNSVTYSMTTPDIEKGNSIKLSFVLPQEDDGKGIMGVEYESGGGELIVREFSGKRRLDIELQSDSARSVKRIFGSLTFNAKDLKPIYLDSISITLSPIDSVNYTSSRRNQNKYGALPQ